MKRIDVLWRFSGFISLRKIILQPSLLEDIEFVFAEFLAYRNKNTNYFSIEIMISALNSLTLRSEFNLKKFPNIKLPRIFVYCLYLNVPRNSICMGQDINVGHIAGKWSSYYSSSSKFGRYEMLPDLAGQF